MKNAIMKARIPAAVIALVLVLGYVAPASAFGSPAKTPQGYLGVGLRDVTEDQVAPLKLKEARGAEIIFVDHDGPACKAGLQAHDVIVQINGTPIDNGEQLRRMLHDAPPGREITLVISRDGQERTIVTQLANRDEVGRKAWEERYIVPEPADSSSSAYSHAGNGFFKSSPSSATGALKGTHSLLGTTLIVSSSYTGAKLEVMGPQLAEFFGAQGSAGLLVRSVDTNSPAADAGLKAGDVVVKVNSVPVTSGTDWVKIVHENRGKPINVVVIRDKKEHSLTMRPDDKKRSSIAPGVDLEEFFGFSDEARQTREALARLEPMFNELTGQFQQSFQQVRCSPEMQRLKEKMESFANDPEFQKQIDQAREQLHAAANAMRRQLSIAPFQMQ